MCEFFWKIWTSFANFHKKKLFVHLNNSKVYLILPKVVGPIPRQGPVLFLIYGPSQPTCRPRPKPPLILRFHLLDAYFRDYAFSLFSVTAATDQWASAPLVRTRLPPRLLICVCDDPVRHGFHPWALQDVDSTRDLELPFPRSEPRQTSCSQTIPLLRSSTLRRQECA